MDTSVSQEGNTPNGGATEDQILEGYGAYVNGQLVEGNIPTANVTDTTINNLNDTVTIPGHTYINENLTIGLSSSFLKDATSGATATANKMLQGETAYVDGELITGTIPSLTAKTYTPGTTNQTIASGKYLSGTQTIKGDSDLKATNIKAGVEIFGITGNSNVVDTSAGTATADKILKGEKAYVDGKLVTGTLETNIIVQEYFKELDYSDIINENGTSTFTASTDGLLIMQSLRAGNPGCCNGVDGVKSYKFIITVNNQEYKRYTGTMVYGGVAIPSQTIYLSKGDIVKLTALYTGSYTLFNGDNQNHGHNWTSVTDLNVLGAGTRVWIPIK